jgi:predicted metal-dependent HD superfamily phosphohydrolase
MDYKALQNQVEQYVRTYFAGHSDVRLTFHNLRHTQDVVRAAMQMGDHYQLSERDYAVLITAAWFHDAGYFTDATQHEQIGLDLATNFLKENGVEDATFIQEVADCILATKMPQAPKNLLGEILCDADLFHLGTDNFADKNSDLRKEKEAFKGEKITKSVWREANIKFISAHRYFTDYARLLLDDVKEKHLNKLKEKEEEKMEEKAQKQAETVAAPVSAAVALPTGVAAVTEEPKEKKNKKDKKDKRPDRGIETLFRIASNNNQRLSNMADNKAHIMITVNSIILSAVISLLLGKLGHNPHLTIPSFITLVVCVLAIIFSILATRPSIPKGKFTHQEIEDKSVNLMFFGNFYKMHLDEYAEGMKKVMDDSEFLYSSLIKDVYSQGVVLGKKYKLLRISYSIFMFGLIIAVLSFLIAIIIYYSHQQG